MGEPAKRQAVTNSKGTIYSIKRFMGRRHSEVQAEEKMVPYEVVGGPNDFFKLRVGGKEYTPRKSETIATLPGGWDLAHAIRLGIKPFAELGANSEALSGSQADSPCSCRAIFESAPVAMLQSPLLPEVRPQPYVSANPIFRGQSLTKPEWVRPPRSSCPTYQ